MGRTSSSVFCSALGIVLLLAARSGAAERYVSVGLDWSRGKGAESCLEREGVVAAVETRLGRTVFGEAVRADVRLVGRAQKRDDGSFSVQLVLTSSDGRALGQRELESSGRDCSALDDSLALALAIMLDLTRSELGQEAFREPVRTELQKTPIQIPRDTAPGRPPWVFEFGTGAAVTYGWTPSAGAGIQLQAWVTPPRFWRTGLMAARFAAIDRAIAVAPAGVSFRLQALALAVCPLELQIEAARLSLCAIERLAHVRAEAFGFDENRTASETTLAAGVLGSASWSFWQFLSLDASFSVEVPWVQTSFVYQRADGEIAEVFRTRSSVEILALSFSAYF